MPASVGAWVGSQSPGIRAETPGRGARGGSVVSAMTSGIHVPRFRSLVAGSIILFAACSALLFLPTGAYAANVYVAVSGSDTTGTGSLSQPYATVQHAVSQAVPYDVVCVGPGIFHGDVNMRAHISLKGASPTLTTLKGTGTGPVITVNSLGTGGSVHEMISGFTITGGRASSGGGIACAYSAPTITGNTITGNVASLNGGGIYCDYSLPWITDNTISSNVATQNGGGIYVGTSSWPYIISNLIASNTARDSGGAVFCDSGSGGNISGNTMTGNAALGNSGSSGGGAVFSTFATPMLMSDTMVGNSAYYAGGALFVRYGTATVLYSTLGGNSARYGGAICSVYATLTLDANGIMGNEATNEGGGVWTGSGDATLTNNVVAGNRAGVAGGLYLSFGAVKVVNDTIVDNRGTSAGGVVWNGTGGATITNCIIWGNNGDLSGCSATYSDISAGNLGLGNICASPVFAATATADYHLMAGSPCIDVATSTAAPARDRIGCPRPWGAGVDMGAYEYYVPVFRTATSLSGLSSVNVNKTLVLSGIISAAGSPYGPPGQVVITKTRLVGKKWKGAGSATVGVVGGAYSYSFKPTARGSWRFVASYSGGTIGWTVYQPSKSGVKGVKVK
jgi:parallel beta-helix repeat protein